jgi:hypothetical protein
VTTPTAVARSVGRDAETRARAALDDVLAAHTALRDAETALADATLARDTAAPQLARAITTAAAAGITTEHLTDLGITVPTARTLRRRHRGRTTPLGTDSNAHPRADTTDHPRADTTDHPRADTTDHPRADTNGHPGADTWGHSRQPVWAGSW